MKPFTIALIAFFANLILLLGLLVSANIQNPAHLTELDWVAFAATDVLYSLLVAGAGRLMGGFVNGLLVYPRKRVRNYIVSQLNTGIVCFLLVCFFSWSTGSFEKDNSHFRYNHEFVHITITCPGSDSLYKNVVNRGFHAF